MKIIIVGNPIDGVGAFGPFLDHESAVEAAESDAQVRDMDWQILDVHALDSSTLHPSNLVAVATEMKSALEYIVGWAPEPFGWSADAARTLANNAIANATRVLEHWPEPPSSAVLPGHPSEPGQVTDADHRQLTNS